MTKYGKRRQRETQRMIRKEQHQAEAQQRYEPNHQAEYEETYQTMWIGVQLLERKWVYRGKIVAFSISLHEIDNQEHRIACIFRYDMAINHEPNLHQHVLHPGGDNTGDKTILLEIPAGDTGANLVNKTYYDKVQEIYTIMGDQYERWCTEQ